MLRKSDKFQLKIGRGIFENLLKLSYRIFMKGENKMKFNEKLIKLRKEKGLSQEELGYKLNVTRQTVSKWELGQTTPEMDKLVEIGKVFGISLDELTSETEANDEVDKIEDKPINDKSQNNSTLKIILLVALILVIVGGIFYAVIYLNIFNFGKGIFDKANEDANEAKSIINRAIDAADKQINEMNDEENSEVTDKALDIMDKATSSINEERNKEDNLQDAVLEGIINSNKEMQEAQKEIEEQVKKEQDKLFNN